MPQKQKIGLIIFSLIILSSILADNTMVTILFTGLILPLMIMGFGIILYKKIYLPLIYWPFPIIITMCLPVYIFNIPIKWVSTDFTYYFVVIVFSLILLLSRYILVKEAIRVSKILDPISNTECFRKIINLLLIIIAEELLFRIFFNSVFTEQGWLGIIIGSMLFTYYHYFNRFSANIYRLNDYFYHFLLASGLSLTMINFDGAVLPLIIGHIIYNSTNFITVIIQKFNPEGKIT